MAKDKQVHFSQVAQVTNTNTLPPPPSSQTPTTTDDDKSDNHQEETMAPIAQSSNQDAEIVNAGPRTGDDSRGVGGGGADAVSMVSISMMSRGFRYRGRYIKHLSVLAGVTAWMSCRWFFHRQQIMHMSSPTTVSSSSSTPHQHHPLTILVVCHQLLERFWSSFANTWSTLGTHWFLTALLLTCLLLSWCHETIAKWFNRNRFSNNNRSTHRATANSSPLGFLTRRYKRGYNSHSTTNNGKRSGYSSSRGGYSSSSSSPSCQRQMALSQSEPFVATSVIQDMTLQDVAHVFSYASRVNHVGFDLEQFYVEHSGNAANPIRPVTRTVLEALNKAMAASRGSKTLLAEIDPLTAKSDTMDALAFCGAVRIFAEWRSLRCIPQGYGKYAFGMNMSHRDICQNVQKVEEAVHEMLMEHEHDEPPAAEEESDGTSPPKAPPKSPTLRQVLEHEAKSGQHPKLPVLTDHSAGSGVLWIQRQITYYGFTLENTALVPLHFPDPRSAYLAAYEKVYAAYHGFLTRTMILTTIDSCPTEHEMRREMNAPYKDDIADEVTTPETAAEQDQPLVTQISVDEDDDATEDEDDSASLLSNVVSCGSEESLRLRAAQQLIYEDDDDDEVPTVQEMEIGDKIMQVFSLVFGLCVCDSPGNEGGQDTSRDAIFNHQKHHVESSTKPQRNDVPFYLSSLRPLEDGWIALLKDVNMIDPTRV